MAIIQVIVDQLWNGEEIENTHFFDVTGGGSGDFAALATILDTVYDITSPERDQEWAIAGYRMRVVDGTGQPYISVPTSGTVIGDVAGEDLPTPLSVVSFCQALTGKPNKSWNFHGGFSESSNTSNGDVSLGTLAVLVSWVSNMLLINNVNGKVANWVTARLTKTSPQSVSAFNDLALGVVSDVWRYVKSRRR